VNSNLKLDSEFSRRTVSWPDGSRGRLTSRTGLCRRDGRSRLRRINKPL